MKESQPPQPNSEEQPFIESAETTDEEAKPSASHPPEHISKIIERGSFAPAIGSIINPETVKPEAKPSPQEVETAVDPEMVLGRVEYAADQNAPIELEFELSHEAKDQPVKDEPKTEEKKIEPSASDKTIYANNYLSEKPESSNLSSPEVLNVPSQTPVSAPKPFQSPKSLYKKAILAGLAVALVLISLFVVITALI